MKSSPIPRSVLGFVAVALGLATSASAQSVPAAKQLPLPSIPVERVLPNHLANQKQSVLSFQRARLDVPATADVPFTLRITWDGVQHELDLYQHSVRDTNYRLIAMRDGGVAEEFDAGPIHTFRGTVRDDKDAIVAGSLLASGMEAVVVLGDGRHIEIQPDYEAWISGDHNAFISFDAANRVACCDTTCGVDDLMRVGVPPPIHFGHTPACSGDFCLAEVAIDCDFPLYQGFNSSFSLTQDIAQHVLNVANIQYERELHIRHRLTATIVRTSAGSEPAGYATAADRNQLLTAFTNDWNANQGGITRDLTHLLTGRFSGGLAFVGVVCANPGQSYGLSALPFSIFAGNVGLTCYANIMAHEMGHNWGANHCTCQNPPYTMNPTFRPCPLRFDPATSIPEIDSWRDANSGCLSSSVYNDDSAYAQEIGPGLFFDSNVSATVDGSATCGLPGPDVWYFYQPAFSGTVTIDTCNAATNFDTVLSIHTGSPGTTSNQIACNDDTCLLHSSVSTSVTGGQTYWIRAAGYNGASGLFGLNLVGPASRAPINDTFANAMDIGPGRYWGNTGSAASDGGSSCDLPLAPDVFYRYTPYSGEMVTVSTFGSLLDTVLSVYDATGSTELFCNDDSAGTLQSQIQFQPTGGTTYVIRVAGYNALRGGFELDLAGPDSEIALCSNAQPISVGTRIGSFQGVFATDGTSTCPHDEEPDVWYSYTATSAGTLAVSTCGTHDLQGIDTGVDTVLSLHTGCPGTAANQIACNDDNFGECGALDTSVIRDSFVSTNVTPGQVVFIRLSRYSGFQGRKPYLLNVELRPPNDDCSAAIPIGNGTFTGTLVGATHDGSSSCGFAPTTGDVWYLYTATCTGSLVVSTCGTHDAGGLDTQTDTILSLHTGCPGNVSNELACNDDAILCGSLDQGVRRDSATTATVVAGQQILIRVANYESTQPTAFTLRTSCGAGAAFCLGDGVGTACPCANNAALGTQSGCLSSIGVGGRLGAGGTPSLSNDTVTLGGSNMPSASSCLYFQGTTAASFGLGATFGDGLRCAAGSIIRLGTKTNSGGASAYPVGGDASVHVRGAIASPGTRYYQCWYRNAAAFCAVETFNLTNGFQIGWSP